MSNALAIAAVTTMLDYLLTQALARSESVSLESVTAKPLDKARDGGDSTNQINIFLYQTLPNAAWRNRDLPNRTKQGETGRSPLALTLSYLITAYGKNNDDIEGQRLLGMAMQSLHDHPEINPQDIEKALKSTNLSPDKQELLASSNLKNQIDRIRITPQIFSVEEISKLWSIFQTPYRISAAYEVSVVLIESAIPTKAALPVLFRGKGDHGVTAQADLIPPYPTLESLTWLGKDQQSGLVLQEPGNQLTLQGHHLNINGPDKATVVRFSHPQLDEPIEILLPSSISAEKIEISLPNNPEMGWLAGFYTVMVRYEQETRGNRFSNALPVAIAPSINIKNKTVSDGRLTLDCIPSVRPGQQVSLLVGSREIPFSWDTDQANALSNLAFNLTGIASGKYFVRLRVDGVDSPLITRSPQGQLKFNSDYEITVLERN